MIERKHFTNNRSELTFIAERTGRIISSVNITSLSSAEKKVYKTLK